MRISDHVSQAITGRHLFLSVVRIVDSRQLTGKKRDYVLQISTLGRRVGGSGVRGVTRRNIGRVYVGSSATGFPVLFLGPTQPAFREEDSVFNIEASRLAEVTNISALQLSFLIEAAVAPKFPTLACFGDSGACRR